MAWTFVRPADQSVLSGRPLLDIGTGDGQTLRALAPEGFVVGIDETLRLLERGSVNASALHLPFSDATFTTVLAADLIHHLSDVELAHVLGEISRVLRRGGRLVAWWYERTTDPSPDAPRHPRSFDEVAAVARAAGLEVTTLKLVAAVPDSATVGLLGRR